MAYVDNFIYLGPTSILYDEEGIPQIQHDVGNIRFGQVMEDDVNIFVIE